MFSSIAHLSRPYVYTLLKLSLLLCGCLLVWRSGLALDLLHSQSAAAGPEAVFQLVEQFDSLALGALDGQNGWHATSGVTVASDPENAANRVMAVAAGDRQAYKALPTVIDNANTGTLHFRLRRNGHMDGFAGASDLAAPNDWSSYETQFGAQAVQAADAFIVRDSTQFDVIGGAFSDQTWYCVWLMTNNASNTYQVYAKGGALAQPTQLNAGGQTAFGFRNGGSDPLLTFLTRMDSKSQGSFYLDDIYVDPTSQNLAVPGNDCGALPIDTTPPLVDWLSPVGNTQVHEAACAATVALEATASDVSGINRVEFSRWDAVNNVTVPIATDGTPPYQASIDVCALNMEWNEIGAYGTDNVGNQTYAYIWIYRTQPPVNQPPTVSISSPANGTTVVTNSTIQIAATAGDMDGIVVQVAFFANSAPIVGCVDTLAPYACSWTPTTPGLYNLTAQATDNQAGTTLSTAVAVTVNQSPTAKFSANQTSGNKPLAVNFIDQSTGSIHSWSWTFSDGGTSTEQSPSHTYANAGDYTVSLTVSGPAGANTKTSANYIHVSEAVVPIVANFSANPLNGNKPLTVNFTNQSTGSISSWAWTFGDGSTSTEQNPSHIYSNPGDYTVSLTASGPGGTNSATKTTYIHVNEPTQPPTANFGATATSGDKPLAVTFTDQSTGNITSWSWNFGDGGTSTQQSPSHTYTNAGDYTVALTVSGPAGANTKTAPNYIHVAEPAPSNQPSLSMPEVTTAPGSRVTLQAAYTAKGNNISSLLFSIDYDQTRLTFDPTDQNGDGIPESVQFSSNLPSNIKTVSFAANDTTGELDFMVADLSASPKIVPDGVIFTITFAASASTAGAAFVNFTTTPAPSFGGASGDVTGVTDGGSILITGPPASTAISANPTTIVLGNGSNATSEITVLVRDASTQPLPNQKVSFTATLGDITPQATTDANGKATAIFHAGGATGTATITVQAGNVQGSITIEIQAAPVGTGAVHLYLPVVRR